MTKLHKLLSEEDMDNIEVCYRTREWSLRALAGIYEVSTESIRKVLLNRGVPMNPSHKRLSDI